MALVYQVYSASSLIELEHHIVFFINNGWKLKGGVSVAYNPMQEEMIYAQALVRDEYFERPVNGL